MKHQTSTCSDEQTEDDRKTDNEVLLLNASEEVITVIDWKKAVHLLFTGKATKPYNYDHCYEIKTSRGVYHLPTAIILVEYVHIPYKDCAINKTNILKRDKSICQYCGKHLGKKDFTIDHIIPKSKGGQNTWTNLVASCRKCNFRKGSKTLKEAKMSLLKDPKQPSKDYIHIVGIDTNTNKSWSRWIEIKEI